MKIDEFIQGTPIVPRPLRGDAYTIGSGSHVSEEASEFSVYHIVARRGLQSFMPDGVAQDDRLIFCGLQRIIRDLLTKPVTMEEIEESDRFLATFHAGGTPYRWDRDMWIRIVDEHGGIIPIRIEAMEEGQVFFPGEPVIQVIAENGFGELAAWFEANLVQVWAETERLTALAWWREWLRNECRRQHPSWTVDQVNGVVSFMCHDFGARAGICGQESEVLGRTHTLVFPGTDTVAGAYQAWKGDGERPHACSIHALAHRTVMGFTYETDCHDELYQLGKKTGITAHVLDTTNFEIMTRVIAKKIANSPKDTNIVVARPDSGDSVESIMHILDVCESFSLFSVDEDGNKVATRMGWIQGNGMTWESMMTIISAVQNRGWSPFASGAFGVGGHLRNSINRDHLGMSMKLAEVGHNRKVCKKSNDVVKQSIPGRIVVDSLYGVICPADVYPARPGENLLKMWYDESPCYGVISKAFGSPCLTTPGLVRDRVNIFLSRSRPTNIIHDSVLRTRQMIFEDNEREIYDEIH